MPVLWPGRFYVDQQKEDKPGASVSEQAHIEVRGPQLRYVSRGGLKLEKAMQEFPITLTGKTCMDIGASTGGFTDCMLQNGARRVYSEIARTGNWPGHCVRMNGWSTWNAPMCGI